MRRLLLVASVAAVAGCGGGTSRGDVSPSAAAQPSSPASPALVAASLSPAAAAPERPYELTCGPMDVTACETWADEIVAAVEKEHPGKTVVSLVITGSDGDYDLFFDDGSGIGADIN